MEDNKINMIQTKNDKLSVSVSTLSAASGTPGRLYLGKPRAQSALSVNTDEHSLTKKQKGSDRSDC